MPHSSSCCLAPTATKKRHPQTAPKGSNIGHTAEHKWTYLKLAKPRMVEWWSPVGSPVATATVPSLGGGAHTFSHMPKPNDRLECLRSANPLEQVSRQLSKPNKCSAGNAPQLAQDREPFEIITTSFGHICPSACARGKTVLALKFVTRLLNGTAGGNTIMTET